MRIRPTNSAEEPAWKGEQGMLGIEVVHQGREEGGRDAISWEMRTIMGGERSGTP